MWGVYIMDRLVLHDKLVEILGTTNVYYNPPENVTLKYPCILYNLTRLSVLYAADKSYSQKQGYTVTHIDAKSASDVPDKLLALPYTKFERTYKTQNLTHTVFTVYNQGGL